MKNKYVVLSYDDSGYLGHIHCIVNTEVEAQRLENEFLGLTQLYSDYYNRVDPNKPTKEEWCNKYLFKGDRYWVCPKDLIINSIETSHACGKSTCTDQEPVISEE